MATSLPVSLPEPLHVDLGNIFPNYNLNDVTSSTSTASKATIPVQFEQTIKQEPDSDSEVECIMSGTSPLPSGVMDEVPEITESSTNEVSTNAEPQPEHQILETQNQTETEVPPPVDIRADQPEMAAESARNESESNEIEIESHILPTNIVIKTERFDSPVPEILENAEQESTVSSVRRNSDNSEDVATNVDNAVTTSTTSERPTESVPVTTTSTVNNESRDINLPLLRFIKTERISPAPIVHTSFQTIEGQTNDGSNSCEVSSDSTVPVLTRIKIERISPTNIRNDCREVSVDSENSPTVNDSSDVSSSHNPDLNVQITNVFSEHQSPPTRSDEQTTDVTTNDNTECTSSSSQKTTEDISGQQVVVDNTEDANEIDVQDIAFDCFYSNDDQQMHTYSSESATSSVSFPASDVNTFVGFNSTSDNNNHQNNQQFTQIIPNNTNQIPFSSTSVTNSIITSSDPTQQQFFVVNTSQQPMSNTLNANTFSIDNNNVVMNSPLHSDEECMLLDSPQQSAAYEVTIGSEPNLDDSMDNL